MAALVAVFGGCCANVFSLELLLSEHLVSGIFVTFVQFLGVTLGSYICQFDVSNPPFFLEPNRVPVVRWVAQVLLFFAVSVLNNQAFKYNISVPLHTIIRSGGPVTTMLLGLFMGRRYSRSRIVSVFLLSIGVAIAAWPENSDTANPRRLEEEKASYLKGITILLAAQLLAALMGLYSEATYRKYRPNWRQTLFYTHALSLPLFLPFVSSLWEGFSLLKNSLPLDFQTSLIQQCNQSYSRDVAQAYCKPLYLPRSVLYLALNVLTQFACVTGVNIIAANSTALTLTIVLNIRKLISLLMSVLIFNDAVESNIYVGAGIVLGSSVLYSLALKGHSAETRLKSG